MNSKAIKTWLRAAAALSFVAGLPVALAELPQVRPVQTLHPRPAETLPSGEGRPQFGAAIAVRNDTALVAMPTYAGGGRVAVFIREGTRWRRSGSLPCLPGECFFVHSVALRDNIAVVGALDVLFVFRRSNGQWALTQRIDSPEPGALQFGSRNSVRYEGGFITAVAYNGSDAPSALYVFEISSAGKLLRTSRLAASDGIPGDGFGVAVGMALDTIVVGAPDAGRTSSSSGTGAAYIFRRHGTGWVERRKLIASDGEPSDAFGITVAIDRGLILVAAPNADRIGGDTSQFEAGGAVYAFERQDGVWTERAKFRPSVDQHARYTDFGMDIVMFGERAVISAIETPTDPVQRTVVFEYERSAQGLTATSFGRSPSLGGIALFNNVLMLGAPRESVDSAVGHVAVYNLRAPVQ